MDKFLSEHFFFKKSALCIAASITEVKSLNLRPSESLTASGIEIGCQDERKYIYILYVGTYIFEGLIKMSKNEKITTLYFILLVV